MELYDTSDPDDFIKYVIAWRNAYIGAFLNEPLAMMKKRQFLIYLITPHGLMPFHCEVTHLGGAPFVCFIKTGDTHISMVQ